MDKSIIENIICMPLDKVVIAEIAATIPSALSSFYREAILDDNDNDYGAGFYFEVTMELSLANDTVMMVIYVKG
jgi:hypothetical protein